METKRGTVADFREHVHRRDEHYLLAQRYINHSKSIQGTGKRWATGGQRALMVVLMVVVTLLAIVCIFAGLGILVTAAS